MKIKITKKTSSMYFYQPKYNIIRLINKWMLNERWVQGELFVNTGECTVSVNREKWRVQVNALWVHEKMGKLNFLYLYHGSIGQYHFNNETSFLLPRWIMGLEKWWYWQTFKFKRQLMSLCMLKYHRSQQYCKVAAKNNLHTIAYTFLRIYALLLHTCDTTSFEFPR